MSTARAMRFFARASMRWLAREISRSHEIVKLQTQKSSCSAREKVQQLRTQLRMPEKHLPGTQRAREGGQVCARGGAQCDERTEAMPADHMQLAHALVQPQQS